MSHNFKKHFGQNFIRSTDSILNFISALGAQQTDRVLEIGPGRGAITEYLAMNVETLVLLEIDDELIPYLEERFGYLDQVDIVHADVLQINPKELLEKYKINKIAGALPYNISKKIINNFCMHSEIEIEIAVFILQKEVAEDYAGIGEKGSFLNHIYSLKYEIELVEVIEKSKFYPIPEVDSGIIKLSAKNKKEIKLPTASHEAYIKFVKNAFRNPRKKLKKNLKSIYRSTDWDNIFNYLEFSENTRVEELSKENMIELFKKYEQA